MGKVLVFCPPFISWVRIRQGGDRRWIKNRDFEKVNPKSYFNFVDDTFLQNNTRK